MATPTRSEVLDFLQEKVRDAEGMVDEARKQAALKQWSNGRPMSKEEQLHESALYNGVAEKYRRESEMFRTVIGELFK